MAIREIAMKGLHADDRDECRHGAHAEGEQAEKHRPRRVA